MLKKKEAKDAAEASAVVVKASEALKASALVANLLTKNELAKSAKRNCLKTVLIDY